MPQTVTCHVLSSDTLTALSTATLDRCILEQLREVDNNLDIGILESSKKTQGKPSSECNNISIGSSLVLAGLHACGDLSVNMLRLVSTFPSLKYG